MQQKNTSRSPSIKKTENGSNSTPSKPTDSVIPSFKYFQSITELPLSKFIEVAVDDNYAALVISGNPDMDVLKDAWYEIYQEFLDSMGDANQLLILKLYKEITRLAIQQEQIQMLIDFLSVYKYKKYEDQLNKILLTKFQFKDKRKDDLERSVRIARQMSIQIDIKQMQLNNIRDKAPKDGQKISRGYFQSILITLSDFAKYPVLESITTFEFCERVKRLTAFAQAQKQKKK
jgi:hypothetical protein